MARKRQKPGDRNYVNNEQFTKELDRYSLLCRKAAQQNKPEPSMNDYLGVCIMKMAERLATTPRFNGYPYKEEMIGNAIVAAVKYAKNFDGDRFNNGFAYVTQILFSHMIQTIKKEKQMYKTNMELIQQARLDVFGRQEMVHEIEAHAQMIADQKLQDMEDQKQYTGAKGFQLRSGYTKEEREAFKGTPMDRSED